MSLPIVYWPLSSTVIVLCGFYDRENYSNVFSYSSIPHPMEAKESWRYSKLTFSPTSLLSYSLLYDASELMVVTMPFIPVVGW